MGLIFDEIEVVAQQPIEEQKFSFLNLYKANKQENVAIPVSTIKNLISGVAEYSNQITRDYEQHLVIDPNYTLFASNSVQVTKENALFFPLEDANEMKEVVKVKTGLEIDFSDLMDSEAIFVAAKLSQDCWRKPASREDTYERYFHINEASGKKVQMMKFFLFRELWYEGKRIGVAVPYDNGKLALLGYDLSFMLEEFDLDKIELKKSITEELHFPKFEIDSNFKGLLPNLIHFEGLNNVSYPVKDVTVCSLKVDEDGSTMKAVAMAILYRGMPTIEIFDHPFNFVITDTQGNIECFSRVGNP